jgi:aldehyde reductase
LITDEDGFFMPSDVDYVDTWTQMEKILHAGTVKAIGISNFNCDQIKRLLDKTNIKPVINQIESQPYWNNDELIQFCQSHQIHVTGLYQFNISQTLGCIYCIAIEKHSLT